MPTDTFSTYTGSDWSGDSHGILVAANWTDLVAGTGTYTHNIYGDNFIATQAQAGGAPVGSGQSQQSCAYFRWDTSSIPDGATISAAVFRFHVDTYANPCVDFAWDWYDFGGGTSTVADWALPNPGTAHAAFDPNTLLGTYNTVYEIPLLNPTSVNTSGYTGIRTGKATSTVPPSGLDFYMDILGEGTGRSVEPQLDVTYTVGSSAPSGFLQTGARRW
jgi:hypothetical protein